jgi:Amt family ammonium transporter
LPGNKEKKMNGGINSGDTGFVLVSAALVLLMTPGLAFFYGGMVRKKNILSILMQCFVLICVLSIQWALFGYTLSFGPNFHGIIGGLAWLGLNGVGEKANSTYAANIPHQVFMIFQCMFAVITPALIVGAFAERIKFTSFVVFMLLWATLVYDPVCHWVWGDGGWLKNLGALDFAGGTVVHINAGIAALATALVIGRRRGYDGVAGPAHNLPLTVLGAALLWFGWFGFNAGSALEANGMAALAFTNTFLATACAVLSWIFFEWMFKGKPSMLGAASGAVAGLVAITPAAGNVGIPGAFAIGLAAGVICLWGVNGLKKMLKVDDSLDVFGVHAVGGITGALLTGIFNSPDLVGPGIIDYVTGKQTYPGMMAQLIIQAKAVGVTFVWTAVVAFISYKITDLTIGLRVPEEQEREGLDITSHGETAYN